MPIIDICTTTKRYKKWMFLVIRYGYVGCCRRGCHGQEATTYDTAITAMRTAQQQCDAEAYDDTDEETEP